MTQATCTRCCTPKPISEFHRNASKRNGIDSWCKPCHRNATTESRAKYAERYNARRRAEYKPTAYEPKRCDTCGKQYQPHRKDQRFCCAECYRLRREVADTPIVCGYCGKTTLKTAREAIRYPVSFCDRRCAGRYKKRPTKVRQGRELVGPVPRRQVIAGQRNDRTWFGCHCLQCSEPFVAARPMKFCGERCARRNAKERRKQRRAAISNGERVYRRRIYERDGWRCKLCGKRVKRNAVVPHPLAPTLDHIVPEALGGPWMPSNLQCAHFRCNSQKGHRGHARHRADQLLLVG